MTGLHLIEHIVLPMVRERSREPGDAWEQAAAEIEAELIGARSVRADLLAALKAMDEALCEGFDTQAKRMAGRKALIAARAAIFKAEGNP